MNFVKMSFDFDNKYIWSFITLFDLVENSQLRVLFTNPSTVDQKWNSRKLQKKRYQPFQTIHHPRSGAL